LSTNTLNTNTISACNSNSQHTLLKHDREHCIPQSASNHNNYQVQHALTVKVSERQWANVKKTTASRLQFQKKPRDNSLIGRKLFTQTSKISRSSMQYICTSICSAVFLTQLSSYSTCVVGRRPSIKAATYLPSGVQMWMKKG